MFVVTMNRKGVKRLVIVACSLLLVCTTLVGGVILLSDDVAQVMADGSGGAITGIEDIAAAFDTYGVMTDVTTGEVSSVVIPSSFDDDFNDFNEIIIQGGGDISGLKSRTVERWKLLTTNRTAKDEIVWAVALVRNNDIVGCYLLSEPSGQVHAVNDDSLSAPQAVEIAADASAQEVA